MSKQLSSRHFDFGEDDFLSLTYFSTFSPLVGLWAPKGPSPPISTTLEALVLRVMHTKFGHNWSRTFRGDVENVKC